MDCPANFSNASFALKVQDNSMSPTIKGNSYVFVEMNAPIKNKEIGLFKLNDDFIIRKLFYKKDNFILKALDKNIKDITISNDDDFQIIGKIYI